MKVDKEIKEDEKINKRSKASLISFMKFTLLLIIISIWYFLISNLKLNINNTKLCIILVYLILYYTLFNIVLFSILQVNYKVKPKVESIRKDVNIVILLSKFLAVISAILIVILSYFIYINNDILITMVYFLPLCGFNLIFHHLACSLSDIITKHQKLDEKIIILGIIFIIIGIAICIYKNVSILNVITQL